MNTYLQKAEKILFFQLALNILLALWFIYYEGKDAFKNWNIWNPILVFTVLVISTILFIFRTRSKNLASLSKAVNVLCLPFSFIYLFNFACVALGEYLNQDIFFDCLYLIAPIFIFLPVVKAEYGNVQSNLGRLLSIQIIFESLVLTNYRIYSSKFLDQISRSQIIFSLFLILFAYVILKEWGYRFSLGLSPSEQFQWKIFIPILLFSLYMIFFNAFLTTNPKSISELLWNWNFEWLNPAESRFYPNVLGVVLNSANAGITEEVWRYLTIVILLTMLKNNKHQIGLTILISSLMFGLFHFNQILSPDRTLIDVSIQALGTIGFGIFLASLFLYSGQIWINMLIHFLYDMVAFSLTPLSLTGNGMLSIFYFPDLVQVVITSTLFIVISMILITGKRKKCIESNIELLTLRSK